MVLAAVVSKKNGELRKLAGKSYIETSGSTVRRCRCLVLRGRPLDPIQIRNTRGVPNMGLDVPGKPGTVNRNMFSGALQALRC